MSRFRVPLLLIALFAIWGLGVALWHRAKPALFPDPSVAITLEERKGGAFTLTYALSRPVAELFVGPVFDGFRARDWTVETPGVDLVADGGDVLVGEKRFDRVAITVRPTPGDNKKQYLPINALAGGTVIYTGHFWPYASTGARADATFNFHPAPGRRIAAFGASDHSFSSWNSPHRRPAFVYFGPLEPVKGEGLSTLVDPRFPDWAAAQLARETPAILAALARLYQSALPATPEFFIFFEPDADEARLAYHGDALPGQVQLVFKGGGWGAESPEGARLLDAAIAHESAHLWQTATRPSDHGVPARIHEGVADAVATEALLASGRLTPAQYDEALTLAQRECGAVLDGRSLLTAEDEGLWRASYACGRVLSVAAARARGDDSVAAFWRAFDERSRPRGYDEELFFAMVEEVAGRKPAEQFRRFPRTVFANAEKEIWALMALANSDSPRAP